MMCSSVHSAKLMNSILISAKGKSEGPKSALLMAAGASSRDAIVGIHTPFHDLLAGAAETPGNYSRHNMCLLFF